MSIERPYVTAYYDSESNVRFRDALINDVITPAIFTALYNDIFEGQTTGNIMEECDVSDNDEEDKDKVSNYRTHYDFFAERDDGMVVITSTGYERLCDLNEPAISLLHDEIQASHVVNDIKERYRNNLEGLRTKAVIETFIRRSFYIRKINDSNEIRVGTYLGYSVDGREIDHTTDNDLPLPELDRQRETVFEVAEVVEIVQALLSLELISESHAKKFIDQEF
jgi:hypothetical protein